MPLPLNKAENSAIERIENAIRFAETSIRRQFLELVRQAKDRLDLTEIADLLEAGRVDDALSESLLVMQQMGTVVVNVTITSAVASSAYISGVTGVPIVFNQVNDRAVRMLQEANLRVIREMTSSQIEAIRQALIDGTTRGLNPRQQAVAFRDAIGLTARQEQAVANYRTMLEELNPEAFTRTLRDRRFDPTVRRAIQSGDALSPEQIDRMVERYREQTLRYRSEVIARTEALRAVHEADEEAFQQAMDSGDLEEDEIIQTWSTARDERVRGSHRPMNGQRRRLGEPFTTGNGYSIRYPGDSRAPASETIQCRCVLARRIQPRTRD
ncbi:putative head morphogenesis protein [Pseudomonas phage KPP23]|nr:head morphogenesis protein [Pseudomonas phage RSP]BAO53110.1 putative head morphogenesis protein [Pseudomonas phage KPP23]